jgi:hypothetical protein
MYRTTTTLLDTLLRSSLALAISAVILLTAFSIYAQREYSDAAAHSTPLLLTGKSFLPQAGTAKVSGEALEFDGYEPRNGEFVAIAVYRDRIQAEEYPLLRYQIDTEFPGPALKLIWRTEAEPEALKSADLQGTEGESDWLELSRSPDWTGALLEIGVYAYTDDEGDALSIAHLTLEPADWRGNVASYWSDLTGFRGWTSRTINQMYGAVDTKVLSPVLAAAAWSALAVILLLASGLFTRIQASALAAAVVLPWIALDLLWQKELMSQLIQTRDQFAGKTVEEKHLADVDRHIYRYVMRLKQDVLPQQNARIVILHNSHSHNFTRLKAQYYLLPHNVYNYGRVPPDHGLETIEYVLVLGEVPRIQYDTEAQALVWKNGRQSLPAELLDDDFMGRLYRVLPQPAGTEEAQ